MTTLPVLAAIAALLIGGCGSTVQAADRCAEAKLAAWPEAGEIRAQFELRHAPAGAPWEIVIVHEGHVAWRGRTALDRRGALWLDRRLPDYEGADRITVRAAGPHGRVCSASRTLPDPE